MVKCSGPLRGESGGVTCHRQSPPQNVSCRGQGQGTNVMPMATQLRQEKRSSAVPIRQAHS